MSPKWGITDPSQWNSYGRVYVNRTNADDGYIPQMLTGEANLPNEYTADLLFDDTVALNSFFVVIDPEKNIYGEVTTSVQWLFFTNLSKITPNGYTPSSPQRLDQPFINDVMNFMKVNGTGNFSVKGVYTRVDKVLEQFSGTIKRRTLKYDMQPYFCVRFDLQFIYNPFLNQ